jgi:SAM-dependent methyltransferase
MRQDAITIENARLNGLDLDNYPWLNERHRLFPSILEPGRYDRILDVAAGVGVVAHRIRTDYPCFMLCNDIASESLRNLKANHLTAVSFDLDNLKSSFPFPDETFDAVISLATLEHIINIDHHLLELRRVLKPDGHLFLSVPNYSGLQFVVPFLLTGRTFHNPVKGGLDKYEFYAHVRYFTYKTLVEFMEGFGFVPQITYLPLPQASSRYQRLKRRNVVAAAMFRLCMLLLYKCLTPRWAFHPVIRFSRSDVNGEVRSARHVTRVI